MAGTSLGSLLPFASAPGAGAEWPVFRDSFWVALAVVTTAALFIVATRGFGVLLHRMGKPTWSFTDSWSSTITVGGALVTSLVGMTSLPDQGLALSKATYGVVSTILVALIGLAPGVYNLFRKGVDTQNVPGPPQVQYQGLVIMFLIAATFTLTGALGQLHLFCILLGDLKTAKVLSAPSTMSLGAVSVTLEVTIAVYGLVSLVQTVRAQTTAAPGGLFAYGLAPGAAARALPDWNLL